MPLSSEYTTTKKRIFLSSVSVVICTTIVRGFGKRNTSHSRKRRQQKSQTKRSETSQCAKFQPKQKHNVTQTLHCARVSLSLSQCIILHEIKRSRGEREKKSKWIHVLRVPHLNFHGHFRKMLMNLLTMIQRKNIYKCVTTIPNTHTHTRSAYTRTISREKNAE